LFLFVGIPAFFLSKILHIKSQIAGPTFGLILGTLGGFIFGIPQTYEIWQFTFLSFSMSGLLAAIVFLFSMQEFRRRST
jgi:uncharacterized membrane protein